MSLNYFCNLDNNKKSVFKVVFFSLIIFPLCAFDPAGYVYDIFKPIDGKSKKIQPDIITEDVKGALGKKSDKLYEFDYKVPTKKSANLFPKINAPILKEALKLQVDEETAKGFLAPFSSTEEIYYMTGLDNFLDAKESKGGGLKIATIGEASTSFKKPAKVPVYGKSMAIKDPIKDIAKPIAGYLEDIMPINWIVPAVPADDIIDYTSKHIDESLTFFKKDSYFNENKVLNSKFEFFE